MSGYIALKSSAQKSSQNAKKSSFNKSKIKEKT